MLYIKTLLLLLEHIYSEPISACLYVYTNKASQISISILSLVLEYFLLSIIFLLYFSGSLTYTHSSGAGNKKSRSLGKENSGGTANNFPQITANGLNGNFFFFNKKKKEKEAATTEKECYKSLWFARTSLFHCSK